MSRNKSSARPRAVALAVVAAAAAALFAPAASQAAPPEGQVKVMTRNLYLGADLTPALQAPNPPALAVAAQGIWNTVHTTDFPNRAKLLAKEIRDAKPDLVGLQEVALWRADRTAPSQDGPQTPAEDEEFDFLQLLMDQLNKKKDGPKYKVVRTQREADIETPLSAGNPGDGRLTMRDVVLARKDAGITTDHEYSQRYRKDHSLVVNDIGGTPLDITVWRGYIALDANVRGTDFHFVNTHFEAFDNTAKLAQATELTATLGEVVGGTQDEIGPAAPSGTDLPVVLLGDLNTDNEIVEDEGDTPGHQADELPYARLVSQGLEERSFDGPEEDVIDDAVYSCCFDDELIGEAPATALDDIDHTVDHVMVEDDDPGAGNDPNSNDITLVNSFATGNDPTEYARFNRWGSDHLGVVSVLQFPTTP